MKVVLNAKSATNSHYFLNLIRILFDSHFSDYNIKMVLLSTLLFYLYFLVLTLNEEHNKGLQFNCKSLYNGSLYRASWFLLESNIELSSLQ